MRRLVLALALLLLAACSAERAPQETGVMLSVVAPASLRSRIAAIRVRVHSGHVDADEATWPERGNETFDVETWPPEVFVRAADHRRGWYAHVWGLDEDDAIVAFGEAGGGFISGKTRQWVVTLDACGEACREPLPVEPDSDAGDPPGRMDGGAEAGTTLDAGRDSGARDAAAESGVRDAAADTGKDARVDPIVCGATPCDDECPASTPVHCCVPSADKSVCGCWASGPPCVAMTAADAGTDASGPLPTGNTCATTPAYATPDACSKCICSKCPSQVASCYGSNDAAKNASCKTVRDCAQSNHCTSESCYCGSSITCQFPDGPCVQVYQTAAGATDVGAAAGDPQNPLGRSNQVGTCEMSNCASECSL